MFCPWPCNLYVFQLSYQGWKKVLSYRWFVLGLLVHISSCFWFVVCDFSIVPFFDIKGSWSVLYLLVVMILKAMNNKKVQVKMVWK